MDKLSPELRVKWKDYIKAANQQRPTVVDLCNWLKGQAEIYDDCYTRISSPKYPFPPFKNKFRSGIPSGGTERQSTFSGNYTSHQKPTKLCLLGDGMRHNLSDCSKFKAMFRNIQKHNNNSTTVLIGSSVVSMDVHDLTMHYCTL